MMPQVVGAYFEKLGSKSFAVYSIAVTDADNKTWFVKRRHDIFLLVILYLLFFCKIHNIKHSTIFVQ
jgi:hypothetical protein